jgi:hypothetical protein
MVKAFCHGLSLGIKRGSITLKGRQQDCQWNGIIQLRLGRSSWLPLQQGKSWIRGRCFLDAEGVISVDIVPRGQTINSDLYARTLKTLQKRFRRVRLHKMLLKFSFSTKTHDHTQV